MYSNLISIFEQLRDFFANHDVEQIFSDPLLHTGNKCRFGGKGTPRRQDSGGKYQVIAQIMNYRQKGLHWECKWCNGL